MLRDARDRFPKIDAAWIAAFLIVVGAALRIAAFWRAPSFWEDEVYLVLNIAQRGFSDLWRPMDFCQSAPLGFLWIERASMAVFGVNERAMRLPSLLAGLALLPLVWWVGRRAIGPRPALLALALTAFSANLIRYSNEAKPYGIDALVCLSIASLGWFRRPDRTTRGWMAATWAGVAGIAVSNACVFVLAGLGIVWTVDVLKRRARSSEFLRLGVTGLAWSLTFLASYALFRNAPVAFTYITNFFQPMLLMRQSSVVSAASLIARGYIDPLVSLDDQMSAVLRIFAAALMMLGSIAAWRAWNWRARAVVFTPLAAVLAAACLGFWYFALRLMLFAAPLVAMVLALGAARLADWVGRRRKTAALAAISAVLLFLPVRWSAYRARRPELQALREGVRFALDQAKPGTVFYLYSKAVPAWSFYTTDWRAPDELRVRWLTAAPSAAGGGVGNVPSRGHAVAHEGWDLRRSFWSGWEMVGEPEGILRSAAGVGSNGSDPGWVDNEYGRIMRDFKGRAILVGLSITPRSYSELIDRFQRAGAHISAEYLDQAVWVVALDAAGAGTSEAVLQTSPASADCRSAQGTTTACVSPDVQLVPVLDHRIR